MDGSPQKPIKKIAVFVPLSFPMGMVFQDFFLSFFVMNEYFSSRIDELPFIPEVQLFCPNIADLSGNRTWCGAKAIEDGFDITIHFDADQRLQADTLFRLLNNDYPIYAGMYYVKKEPFHPVVFNDVDSFEVFAPTYRYPLTELFYADMLGMGCVKIDTQVFKDLTPPYFKYAVPPKSLVDALDPEKDKEKIKDIKMKIKYKINDVSEDVYFWRKVNKAGYKIVVDPLIQLGHVRKDIVDQKNFFKTSVLNRKKAEIQKGDDFERWWNDTFPKTNLVKENTNGEVIYVIDVDRPITAEDYGYTRQVEETEQA